MDYPLKRQTYAPRNIGASASHEIHAGVLQGCGDNVKQIGER
jgi:hypothetical protein